MLKKLLTTILALTVGFQPLLVHAVDLDSAFSSLTGQGAALSVNSPGRYQSGARNTFIAGGLEVRIPKAATNPQLFSVTPPRIVAGCNGISAHFGGFSFISGAEFEKMLKSIASGAVLGFVSMLTLKTLCPQCEAVIQFLKSAAQQAARLSKDACQWGQQMAQALFSGNSGGAKPNSVPVCGTTISDSNGSGDFLAAVNGACNSITSAVDALVGEQDGKGACANSPNSEECKNQKEQVRCATGSGNVTWQRLSAFDVGTGSQADSSYFRKLILINLLGAELRASGTDDQVGCDTAKDPKIIDEKKSTDFCTHRLQTEDVLGLFMCGAPVGGKLPGNPSSRVESYCKTFFAPNKSSGSTGLENIGTSRVYKCRGDDKIACHYLELTDASTIFQGEGFLTSISKLLQEGVNAVRTNEPMPEAVIRLMQAAPVPLYQAINAAAVYPAAAADLLDAMALLVAEQFAVALFDESLRMPGRDSQPSCLTQDQASKIMELLASMRAVSLNRKTLLAQNFTVQQMLTEQIRQINLAIQRQVMSSDLLSNGQFATSLNKALSPQAAGAGAATP